MRKRSKNIKCCDHDQKRREMLKILSASGIAALAWRTPVGLLVSSMVDSMIRSAKAAPSGTPRNYVHIAIPGGPPRWLFDLPLRPNGTDAFVQNPLVGTRFADTSGSILTDTGTSNNIIAEYAMHRHGSFYFPYLFAFDLPAPGGGTRPASDLLNNGLFIRGCRMLEDGHDINRVRQIQPIEGGPSLSGLVADYSRKPIPSIFMDTGGNWAGSRGFKSAYGATNLHVSGSRPLEGNMLAAFSPISGSFRTARGPASGNTLTSIIDTALNIIASATETDNAGDLTLSRNRANAEAVFRRGIDGIATEYDRLYAKYLDLIHRASRSTNITGVTNRPIQGNANSVRMGFFNEGQRFTGANLLDHYAEATNTQLASQMAVAEYALVSGLSSSVVIDTGHFRGTVASFNSGTNRLVFDGDPHFSSMVSIIVSSTLFYRALGACMLELMHVLRNTATSTSGVSLFDETIIHLSGDFGSMPRGDMVGSDHGWKGNSVSIYSGIIRGPLITGNIYTLDEVAYSRTRYPGTWGMAAPMASLENRPIVIGNVASTVAALLRIESPTPNDRSLVSVSGSTVTLTSGAPTNVDNT
jgi:hypothetical protein